jgi:Uncharacterised nucleotidyltransferase
MATPAQSTQISSGVRVVPSLTLLLRAASQNRTDLTLADFRDGQIRWAIETGLGPLLRRSTAADPAARRSPLWPLVEGADLTARVIADEQLRALTEIIRACEGRTPPLTLLKGMSICAQHYPERHLRPMRDIDILVEQGAVPIVETLLRQLGYYQPLYPPEWLEGSHHIAPLFHPGTGMWVEVHRALFSANSEVSSDRIFGPENLRAELSSSECQGRPVNRFSDELQLVYIATHWALGFKRVGGMVAMLDLIYLLRNARALRWERIFDWLGGSVASAYVYLLLSYLDRHQLADIAPGVLHNLFSRQRSFGRTNLAILHALLDRYVTDGREFGRAVSARNFDRVWRSLLLPGPPSLNVLLSLWNLLPYRTTLMRALLRRDANSI